MEITFQSLDSVDSTNTWIKNHLSSLEKDKFFCLSANEQTKGRGRKKRRWSSPKSENIYASLYFTLPKNTKNLQCLGLLMAFSITKVLKEKDIACSIKWPNDLLLNEKKIGGILCENIIGQEHIDVILGFGLNINMKKEEIKEIDQPASSLCLETNRKWDKDLLLKAIVKQFSEDLAVYLKKGFGYFQPSINNCLSYVGEPIICRCENNEYEGILHSITCEGALNVCINNTEIQALCDGEISIRKQA